MTESCTFVRIQNYQILSKNVFLESNGCGRELTEDSPVIDSRDDNVKHSANGTEIISISVISSHLTQPIVLLTICIYSRVFRSLPDFIVMWVQFSTEPITT